MTSAARSRFSRGIANNIRDNEPYLNTEYKGIEFTASKRFSRRWQMVAGLTIGRNEGGLTQGTDLSDPNVTVFDRGIIGNDSKIGFRMSGTYQLPAGFSLAGSLVANDGYPFISTYQVTRAIATAHGFSLTRANQTIPLSRRGEERYPNVTMVDLRLSRAFRFGDRRFVPQLDLFNIGNASTIVSVNNAVGGTYLEPREILSPRIIRIGFSLDF